jgi:uncharacterized membrane protein YagU involved in acid resistance
MRNTLLTGLIAGFIGTAAMTVAMEAMYRRLPKQEQYPLPPREITVATLERLHMEPVDEQSTLSWTLALHFGYGSAGGTLYAVLMPKLTIPMWTKGMAFGLSVWTASYLGWVPALGLLSSANRHPPRRNALMITAHLVWGIVIASATQYGLKGSNRIGGIGMTSRNTI